jgi:uncharacterized protein YbgA (DUF1722 family)
METNFGWFFALMAAAGFDAHVRFLFLGKHKNQRQRKQGRQCAAQKDWQAKAVGYRENASEHLKSILSDALVAKVGNETMLMLWMMGNI